MLLLVDIVHDGGEDGGLDLPHLGGAVLFSNDFVESAEASAECRVKMIFDVVIGAK